MLNRAVVSVRLSSRCTSIHGVRTMATKRWKIRRFYGCYSEKVVEAESEAMALALADDCISIKPDQLMSTLEGDGLGYEIEEVGDDEDLTELSDDDKRWIAQYREWLRSQNGQQVDKSRSIGEASSAA